MDILSHGLWAAVGAKAINKKSPAQKVNVWLATFWGMFPDLFAFVPAFVLLFIARLQGKVIPFGRPQGSIGDMSSNPIFGVSLYLYNYSHSLVIFIAVVALVFIANYFFLTPRFGRRLIPWEMGGWAFHILCDIPTHTTQFFPTPIFWPISSWHFVHGFSWGQPWFMVLNYGLLLVVWLYLQVKKLP